jgi:hypothetical protein
VCISPLRHTGGRPAYARWVTKSRKAFLGQRRRALEF